MPIGYSPDDVFEVQSSIDKGCETRVGWKVRAISVAEVRKVRALCKEAGSVPDFEDEQRLLFQALVIGIVGWNRPEPFTGDAMDALLTPEQKYTLAREYPSLLYLAEQEKKVSRLQPASAAALSVKDAGTVNATTSPAN